MVVRPSLLLQLLSFHLLAALAAASAGAIDLEVPLRTPRLDRVVASIPVEGSGNVAVDVALRFDEKGKLACGGECRVDGALVDVKGRVKSKKDPVTYKLVLKGRTEKLSVKIQGEPASPTATVAYRGPKGQASGEHAVTVDHAAVVATISIYPHVDVKGRLTGSGVITSGFGNDPAVQGVLKGKRKGDSVKWTLRAGKRKVAFKGTLAAADFAGVLKLKLPPEKGAREGQTLPEAVATLPGPNAGTIVLSPYTPDDVIADPTGGPAEIVSGRILVDFDDALELATIDAALASHDLERIGLVGSLNLVTARILDGRTELEAQAAIESEPGVDGAPLAYLFEFTASAAERLAGSVPPEEVPEVVGDLALSLFWPHYVMDTFAAHGLAEAIRGDALSDVRLAVVDGGFQRQNGNQRGDELESLLVDPNNFDMVSKVVVPIGSQVTIVEGEIPRVPDIVVGGIDVESNPLIHLPDWIFLDSEVFLFNNLHGLEVASLAVGAGRDFFVGTGRHVRLIPVRWPAWVPGEQIGVTHDSGVSIPMEFKSGEYAAAALAFLADVPNPNLKVINMSWGSRVTDAAQRARIDDTTLSALARHEQQGRILVAGAGNDDGDADEFHPANLSVPRNPGGTGDGRLRNLMTVSGTALPTTTEVDEEDDVDEIFQDVGALPEFEGLRERRYQDSNSGDVVAVSAPAENVTVLNALSTSPFFEFTEGTSFSAPLVAGLAAEMFAVDPSARPSEVIDIIQATADDLVGTAGAPGWDPVFGHGRINAWKALLALVNRADPERPKWLGIRFRSTVEAVRPERLALGGTPILNAITKRVPELDDAADDNARAVPFETATPTATASLFSFEAADLGASLADPTGTGRVALLEVSTEDGTLAYQIPLRLEDVLDARPLGASVDDFVLTLEQQTEDHASLYGRVTAEGAPIAGAAITYASSAGGEGTTTSDADGYYTAYDVAPGAPFEASAETDTASTTVPDVSVAALQARQVNFELGEAPPPGAFVIEAYNNRNGEFSSTEVPGFDPSQADIQLSGAASAPIISWGSDTPEGPKPNVSAVSVELQPSRLEIWGIEDVIWSGIVPPDYATNVIAPPVTYGDFSVPGTNPFPGVSNPSPTLVPGDLYQVRLLWFSNPGFTRTAWLNFRVE